MDPTHSVGTVMSGRPGFQRVRTPLTSTQEGVVPYAGSSLFCCRSPVAPVGTPCQSVACKTAQAVWFFCGPANPIQPLHFL